MKKTKEVLPTLESEEILFKKTNQDFNNKKPVLTDFKKVKEEVIPRSSCLPKTKHK